MSIEKEVHIRVKRVRGRVQTVTVVDPQTDVSINLPVLGYKHDERADGPFGGTLTLELHGSRLRFDQYE